jgi:O-antigen/teichoic acid export membrane protein
LEASQTVGVARAEWVAAPGSATQHIRRSSVLLVGRLVTLGLNFGSQVLLVRYLSRADFGAFSYALAVVSVLQSFATFEMSSALSRWVPIYRERGQNGAAYGSVALAAGFVTVTGTLLATALVVGLTAFDLRFIEDGRARMLLAILAILIPIQSLDALVTSLFAILGDTRTILIRGSIIAPGLRIVLIGGLIALGASVAFLAVGYLAISALGLGFYAWTLWRTSVKRGLLRECRAQEFSYPVRDIFSFASPLVLTVLVWSLVESSDAVLLGYFHGVESVAGFRAVLPLAQLNRVVAFAFGALYLPAASRLYARGEIARLSELYWQTAVWMAALSFPILLCTFSFARLTASLLYGTRYLDSVAVLSLVSLGYFINTALGFNGLTLKTFNKLRFTIGIDVAAVILNIGLNLLTIPRWGALGAAVGTCATLAVHNALKQLGLWKYTGISGFDRRYWVVYGVMLGIPVLLWLGQTFLRPTVLVAVLLTAVGSALVLWVGRHVLTVRAMFPEVERWAWWRFVARQRP